MCKNSRKNRTLSRAGIPRWVFHSGMTLIEIVMALAIIVIVFMSVIPQLRAIRMSWSAERENSELIENGQALMDHVTTHLIRAQRIMSISDPCDGDGHIEYMDGNNNILRYEIGDSNYVQYGPVGNLTPLAGPVSTLQFSCFDTYDLNTPTLDVDYVRSIKGRATFPRPHERGRSQTFTSWTYLRANYISAQFIVGAEYLFDGKYCRSPVLAKVDSEHFLCAYEKPPNLVSDGSGSAVILMPRYVSDAWQITKGSIFQFEPTLGQVPELCQIDATHYLCAYRGPDQDGWAVVLIVDTGTWTVSKATAFEFADATGLPIIDGGGPDIDPAYRPALAKIDSTHYLCAYTGADYDGYAVILTVDSSTYAISAGTPFEFDVAEGMGPALVQIDSTHYLCAYAGPSGGGRGTILEVDTGTGTITKKTNKVFGTIRERPDLAKIDDEHYLCAYGGPDEDGWAVVLDVDLANWKITENTPYEFDTVRGEMPKLQRIDSANFICSYEGDAGQGQNFDYPSSILLYVNGSNWTIYRKMPVKMYGSEEGDTPDIAVIDSGTFFSVYDGFPWKGNAVVLEIDLAILP